MVLSSRGKRLCGPTLPALAAGVCAVLTFGAARATEPACPASVPSLSRAAPLQELTDQVQARDDVRIVAIGSSSTEGVGASARERTYPAQLEGLLKGLWRLDALRVENLGRGGETAGETLKRLEAALETDPDLVIWQLGTNDAVRGGDEEAFRALVLRGIEAARAKRVEMLLLDQQYFPGIKDLARYERYVRIVRQAGRDGGVPVFSRYALMKAWNEQSPAELRTMLAGDSFHMSDRGYACLSRSLGGAIASLVPAVPAVARR